MNCGNIINADDTTLLIKCCFRFVHSLKILFWVATKWMFISTWDCPTLSWYEVGLNKETVPGLIWWWRGVWNIFSRHPGLWFTLLWSFVHLRFLSKGVRFLFYQLFTWDLLFCCTYSTEMAHDVDVFSVVLLRNITDTIISSVQTIGSKMPSDLIYIRSILEHIIMEQHCSSTSQIKIYRLMKKLLSFKRIAYSKLHQYFTVEYSSITSRIELVLRRRSHWTPHRVQDATDKWQQNNELNGYISQI